MAIPPWSHNPEAILTADGTYVIFTLGPGTDSGEEICFSVQPFNCPSIALQLPLFLGPLMTPGKTCVIQILQFAPVSGLFVTYSYYAFLGVGKGLTHEKNCTHDGAAVDPDLPEQPDSVVAAASKEAEQLDRDTLSEVGAGAAPKGLVNFTVHSAPSPRGPWTATTMQVYNWNITWDLQTPGKSSSPNSHRVHQSSPNPHPNCVHRELEPSAGRAARRRSAGDGTHRLGRERPLHPERQGGSMGGRGHSRGTELEGSIQGGRR